MREGEGAVLGLGNLLVGRFEPNSIGFAYDSVKNRQRVVRNATCIQSAFARAGLVLVIGRPNLFAHTLITLAGNPFVRRLAFQTLLIIRRPAYHWSGAMCNAFARFHSGSCRRCAAGGILCFQGALADAVDTVEHIPAAFGLAGSSGARASDGVVSG